MEVDENTPNYEAITKRLDVMRGQLRKVFTATGTRSIQQLKAFIILGESRRNRGIHFLPQSTHNYVTSRTMVLLNSSNEIEQRFRLQHVNGRDHLFATENVVSDHEIIYEILFRLDYPLEYIPDSILATLEDEHSPYNSITEDPPGIRHWCLAGVPREIADIMTNEIFRLTGGSNWTDVEELFENADRLQQLREWKRGLKQGHVGRSPLLNLPEEGPANLVGTFATGARRNGGLRPGLHNLHIAGQEAVLLARLTPELPEIGDLRIPYRTLEEYRQAAHTAMERYEDLLEQIAFLRRRRRNRNTRKNRR
jgi:hypothetical protein